MRSLRTRITLMTVCAIVIAVAIVTAMSVLFIRNNERLESDQMLLLLCETGERNLDYYFNSVQKSVEKVATHAEMDIKGIDDEHLQQHVDEMEEYFETVASKTNGVLTYYYRIDPEVSDTVKGFWYTDLDGGGFVPHEVTDITQYDTNDTSKLVWFTVPKSTGEPIWLAPYITDNLDVRVISYNIPIYYQDTFVGVVGIEIDYSTMAEQVDSIKLYENGYAFLNDEDGNLFFHPRIDVALLTDETKPEVPDGLISDSTFVNYTFDGVEKEAAWLALGNGMRLTVSVPTAETDGDWQTLIQEIIIVSLIVLIAISLFTMYFTRRITRPLEELTRAAEQVDEGDYNFRLDYAEDDEVGRLTSTFKRLASHMEDHISDLNKRVFVDSLTDVQNRGGFSESIEELHERIFQKDDGLAFAIGVFDCDDLKLINDRYGHDKGDIYLQTACNLICSTFQKSPVFRIGGDEFSVILQGEDYENRDELFHQFEASMEKISASTENDWQQVHVAVGIAVYDPTTDHDVIDTVRRADKNMYEDKRLRKEARLLI